ncbi:dTDP-4-dehydrorhamnose 3,5-epimerase [Shewanella profunda]|uniref:dTDP-4-dehydrorhamnose 3,5-epimerase n=1 Tax=Shewanella profunda TaxID=254793 RepID=UPI00200F6298|nr:dTDP-4-dehydrorhamnose 3,5-epimerase [Shewanella profunda]MCL1090134.1 dTDP-4-dehydrorhamnose 3,5-epimerase [Shewanella profunda]
MKCIETELAEVLVFEPQRFGDERGFFMETFRQSYFDACFTERGFSLPIFVQENHSRSQQNVLRGLHFQRLQPQGKLVRVCTGSIFDVAVDIRANSPTYGQWVGRVLSADNRLQMWTPPGFAHGFYVLSEFADVIYRCTDYYAPQDEYVLGWNNTDFSIDWPLIAEPLLSDRDAMAART